MNILDHLEDIKNKSEYQPNVMIIVALASMVFLGLGLQVDAIYQDYLINKSRVENPGLMICFYTPYHSTRWIAQLLGFLGLGLACSILYRLSWRLPEPILYKLTLLGPVLILILDQIMIVKLLS